MALAGAGGGGAIDRAASKRLERDCGAAVCLLLLTRTFQSQRSARMKDSEEGQPDR